MLTGCLSELVSAAFSEARPRPHQASLLGVQCPSWGGQSRPCVPLLSSGSETSQWERGVRRGGNIDAMETSKWF